MDYSHYREGDNFVCLQYYNLKENSVEIATRLHDFYILEPVSYKIDNDTLKLLFLEEELLKNSDVIFLKGFQESIFRNVTTKVQPLSFYQVVFPMLDVEGVEKKDMAKWYKSFYAIKAIVKENNEERIYYYYNSRDFTSDSHYKRP